MPSATAYGAAPEGPWKRTDDVITAINRRIRRLNPRDPLCQRAAFQIRFEREGVERSEADSIKWALGLFRRSGTLPSDSRGGTEENVRELQRFLERLKCDDAEHLLAEAKLRQEFFEIMVEDLQKILKEPAPKREDP